MSKRDSGEFEILLGNKQLLSVFFIVVILLGVFFTMGYILGRNSGRSEERVAQTARQATPPATMQGRKDEPSAFGYATPPPAEPPKAEPVPPAITQPPASQEPEPGGVYLQVAAVKKPEAEVVAEVLLKKGFRSIVAAHPTEPIFRVLVGPLDGADAVAKMREDLLAAGFKPMLRKF